MGQRRSSRSWVSNLADVLKEEITMARVGRFVVDPKAGAYCQITLDDGKKVIVNHDRGGFKGGRITVEVPKLFGLSSDRIFEWDLDTEHARTVLQRLTRSAQKDSAAATPLGAVVGHIQDAKSLDEMKAKFAELIRGAS
jgi:hypothetical protein